MRDLATLFIEHAHCFHSTESLQEFYTIVSEVRADARQEIKAELNSRGPHDALTPSEVRQLYTGRPHGLDMVGAIKMVRNRLNISLREAKHLVDRYV